MKTFIANAAGFIFAQATILTVGTVVTYACHVWFGLTAEQAVDNIVAAQAACAGFMARGWLA